MEKSVEERRDRFAHHEEGSPLPSPFEKLGQDIGLLSCPMESLSREGILSRIALRLERGEEVPVSEAVVLIHLAHQGLGPACFLLGECHRLGKGGFAVDLLRSVMLHRQAYRLGFRPAACVLFLLDGFSREEKKVFERRGPFLWDTPWCREIEGMYHLLHGRYHLGRKALERAFFLGKEEVLPFLIRSYRAGPRKERDARRAFHWAKVAYALRLPNAALSLGECFFRGIGTRRDREAAERLYREEGRNAFAQKRLGDIARSRREGGKAAAHYRQALQGLEAEALLPLLFLRAREEREHRGEILRRLVLLAKGRRGTLLPLSRLCYSLQEADLGRRCFRLALQQEDKEALQEAIRTGKEERLAEKILREGRRKGRFVALERDRERRNRKELGQERGVFISDKIVFG